MMRERRASVHSFVVNFTEQLAPNSRGSFFCSFPGVPARVFSQTVGVALADHPSDFLGVFL